MPDYLFTSESASEGHPDKVCDLVADSLIDAYLAQDSDTRAGCEVLYKGDLMVVAGEVTTQAEIDVDGIARAAIGSVGYRPGLSRHNSQTVGVQVLITEQSKEIRRAADRAADDPATMGASDQGIMFGFASMETPERLPLPSALAHRLGRIIAASRQSGDPGWLRPDGKTAVTVRYVDHHPVEVTHVLVAVQHSAEVNGADVGSWVRDYVVRSALGEWLTASTAIHVNPSGSFTLGGPEIDCGVTGRKIVADTYGGMGRVGGGALSGKDPSKLDRSGTYYCRWIARQLVEAGIAARAEVQVSYAFGLAQPLSVYVETFGSGDRRAAEEFVSRFDFRPEAIIERLNLRRPIYRATVNYGHFGKPGLPWEQHGS